MLSIQKDTVLHLAKNSPDVSTEMYELIKGTIEKRDQHWKDMMTGYINTLDSSIEDHQVSADKIKDKKKYHVAYDGFLLKVRTLTWARNLLCTILTTEFVGDQA